LKNHLRLWAPIVALVLLPAINAGCGGSSSPTAPKVPTLPMDMVPPSTAGAITPTPTPSATPTPTPTPVANIATIVAPAEVTEEVLFEIELLNQPPFVEIGWIHEGRSFEYQARYSAAPNGKDRIKAVCNTTYFDGEKLTFATRKDGVIVSQVSVVVRRNLSACNYLAEGPPEV